MTSFACLENVRCWNNSKSTVSHPDNKLGEWIYRHRSVGSGENATENITFQRFISERKEDIIDSLSTMAKQRNWKTQTAFICCPTKIDGDPNLCYLKNLAEDAIFTKNQYGKSTIVKFAVVDNNAIFVITTISSSVKPLGLVKVTFENEYYLHTSLGSFFTEEGAEKQFTLARGLEWTGGDTFDDYC